MAQAGTGNDVHIALLRGINVGGKNRLPMKQLVAMFEEAGCRDVRTYIQSGNVVFRTPKGRTAGIPGAISEAVLDELGVRIPVVTRSGRELQAVARNNPFRRAGAPAEALHVVFLAERPSRARVASLDLQRSPPDEFAVKGREIYVHLPRGVARTRLTNDYFDRTLKTTSTMRNWKTLLKLVEMSREV